MTEDFVTAKDVAAPIAVTPRPQDAQLIREKLSAALADEKRRDPTLQLIDPAIYSSSVQSLFLQAWAVAAHKHSVVVTIYHLAYALVFNNPESGKKLAEVLGSDVDSFAIGCILQILPLGVSKDDAFRPAVGTVRWVGKAGALALKRGRRSELLPEDLVHAVLDGALPASERAALKRAARVGNARHDAVIGPRPVPLIAAVPSSSRDIIKHMEEVEKGYSPDPGSDVTELRTLLEELEEQVMSKLGTIDQRISAIDDALPRARSGAGLAAAIVAVLILGLAAGMALTVLQPASLIAQVLSISVK